MNTNEVWIKFGEGGLSGHKTNIYAVVRKLKRGGYSLRWVERGFNGYTVSTRTQRFEKLEDLFDEVPPRDLYQAIKDHPEKGASEVWQEEIRLLKKVLGKPVGEVWKPAPKLTRQISLLEVLEC